MKQTTLHIRIAEQGKLHSIEGNYEEALRHFREAMRMVHDQNESDIFFQHYSQCTMEALELSGAHDEVISFCVKYANFLEQKEEDNLIKKHKAFVWQRQAIQHLLKNETEEAKLLFQQSQHLIGHGKQPLTDELLNWIQRGYMIQKHQVKQLQDKHDYFIVREDQVNRKLALPIPESIKQL